MEECHYCEGTDDKEEVYHEIIECITGALDAKDAYTAGHSQRVSEMALKVCELIGLKKKDILKIHIAAHLHDIGKIGIPDAILNKEGRLTDEEFEIMKTHSAIGAGILSKSKSLSEFSDIVLHHHERFDGKGVSGWPERREDPGGSQDHCNLRFH